MTNTNELYRQYLRKKSSGSPVDMRDIAVRMANEEKALFAYMVANDPEQVSALLHASGAPFNVGQNASFVPKPQRLNAELEQLLATKNFRELNRIVQGFRVYMQSESKFTTSPDLLRELDLIGLITMDGDGERRIKVKLA